MNIKQLIDKFQKNEEGTNFWITEIEYFDQILNKISIVTPDMNVKDAFQLAIQLQRNQILAVSLGVEEHQDTASGTLSEIKNSLDSISDNLTYLQD